MSSTITNVNVHVKYYNIKAEGIDVKQGINM